MLMRMRSLAVRDAPKTPMFWTGCAPAQYAQDMLQWAHAQAQDMLQWAHAQAKAQFDDRARIELKDPRLVKVELTALVQVLKRDSLCPQCFDMKRFEERWDAMHMIGLAGGKRGPRKGFLGFYRPELREADLQLCSGDDRPSR